MSSRKKIGVVLFQLGGPDSLDAVEPFLYNLFCDPEIINFMGAGLARKPLAKFIARRRSEIVRAHYAAIGGASPIAELTNRQARALSAALAPHFDATVVVAMRYWHPLTEEAIAKLQGVALDQLVLLPLYPHYSFATTGSSLKEWQRLFRGDGIPVHMVNDFHDHPLYIAALVARINEALQALSHPEEIHLVFSAHGLPMSLVEKGDPYPTQIETTVRLVRERGAWKNPHVLCYQSRVGKQKWLEPSLTETIERLAKSGVRRMLVIPISFVTEHIETLHEINIEAREEAEALGVHEFRMSAALNDSPVFIQALTDLVLKASGMPGIS
ncbi:MAG TPA: ferrochelatase [Candidatus Dormibacteraeota bacterium]|nr:ferrochelatase [Candidatus Dormibacteraeota bacterium]